MIKIDAEKMCCGCAACKNICPKHCITMVTGTLGCLFPTVDTSLCISCGACEKVCPMLYELNDVNANKLAYAAFSAKRDVRFRGASGGLAETFASCLLSENYTVYGAAFDENLNLKCTSAHTQSELYPLLKSKYLQSDISGKYNEIKNLLDSEEKVCFISTPCQVVALKRFLSKEYENLVTIDFFCHGVPSQTFFDDCIHYDEKHMYSGKVQSYIFREKKKNGSTPHYYRVEYLKNNKLKSKVGYYFDSTFYRAFQQYICLRESCYECRFASSEHISDITIGDFHDVDKYVKGINRFDGVSIVILNSAKGNRLWNLCEHELVAHPVSLAQMISDGVCFSTGTKRPETRDDFIKIYLKTGVDGLVKTHLNPKRYIKNRIYYSLPAFIRKAIKK